MAKLKLNKYRKAPGASASTETNLKYIAHIKDVDKKNAKLIQAESARKKSKESIKKLLAKKKK